MSASSMIERVKTTLVALKMPRALEVLDVTLRGIERGEIGAVEAIDALLTEELITRENRRVRMAVHMARLSAIKTLAGFDFAFQPSLDRNRVLALAGLPFIDRAEAVHLIGPPGTGKTHLSLALGGEAVKAGRSVYFSSLADIVAALVKAERDGALRERIRYSCRFALLIVDEIGYLPVTPGGGNLFFQLVNARYEKGAMILTSNRGFAEWGDIFGEFCRRDRPTGQTASPRRRHPDRRGKLPAARARRPLARDRPVQAERRRQSHPADPEAPRTAAKERRRRSRTRLIASPPDWGILRRHF